MDIEETAINNIPDVPTWGSEPVTVDFSLSEFDLRLSHVHWRVQNWNKSSFCICLGLWNRFIG